MDPHEIEFRGRTKSSKVKVEEYPWNPKLLQRIRRWILERKDREIRDVVPKDWILKENVALSFKLPEFTVAKIFGELSQEGIVSGPHPFPGDEGDIVIVRNHQYRIQNGVWIRHDPFFSLYSNWGKKGRGQWIRDGLPMGKQPSKSEIQKHARKRPKLPHEWDGKGYFVHSDSAAFRKALKALTPEKVEPGKCPKCGSELAFRGKNSRKARGHSIRKCHSAIVKNIMES